MAAIRGARPGHASAARPTHRPVLFFRLGRQRHIHIVAAYGDRVRRHRRGVGEIDTDTIMQVETPAVPHTRDCATVQGTVVERCTGMRAHVFHGVKLSLVSEDSDKALPHTKFTPLPFGDIFYTGDA